MSDIFDEVSDDLRREKLKQFWKENGAWIIGGVIGAVLLTGVLSFWREWKYTRNTVATAELTRAVATADIAKIENFVAAGAKNHAMIARFAAAGLHLERGEKDQAVALYNEIADTAGLDKTWRSLARVFSIGQRFDKDDPVKLKKELAALSGDKDVWRIVALELQALLAARTGQMQEAADILAGITADPQAPDDVRTRAFTLRALYVAEIPAAPKS